MLQEEGEDILIRDYQEHEFKIWCALINQL